jgi:UDP-glucose 4-epimerase
VVEPIGPARVLVTGGAGYIGSVVVEELLSGGAEHVVVLDDLSKGHAEAVVAPARLEIGDIADASLVGRLCREGELDAVIHLAASSLVGESVQNPAKYYRDNVVKGITLLDAVVAAGVRRFVFSSTAAVYGEPAGSPITESFETVPTNTYGETKLAFEKALSWYQRAYGLEYTSLRYFNAAGATARNGERHVPETHLIPLVLATAYGALPHVTVFGDDYLTPDGTCVRDYIHVSDLARAHVLALGARDASGPNIFNLGCGGGFSVAQVIDVARRITGRTIRVKSGARRPGDPPVLVASSQRAQEVLSWKPQRQDLATIIEDAWRRLLSHPFGYGGP